MPDATTHLVRIRAERKFKEVARQIGSEITPEHLKVMVRKGITFAQLIQDTNTVVPKATGNARVGVDYLNSLPDEKVLTLLKEAIPEHWQVLMLNPEFAKGVIQDLRVLAG